MKTLKSAIEAAKIKAKQQKQSYAIICEDNDYFIISYDRYVSSTYSKAEMIIDENARVSASE